MKCKLSNRTNVREEPSPIYEMNLYGTKTPSIGFQDVTKNRSLVYGSESNIDRLYWGENPRSSAEFFKTG